MIIYLFTQRSQDKDTENDDEVKVYSDINFFHQSQLVQTDLTILEGTKIFTLIQPKVFL